MRWSIIRTIWLREMRDQLRDRRTLLVILGLPLVLYPLLGLGVLQFAVGFAEKPSVVGVVSGSATCKDFPPRQPPFAGRSVAPTLAWLSATPLPGCDMNQWAGACALARGSELHFDYPQLIDNGQLTVFDYKDPPRLARQLAGQAQLQLVFLDAVPPNWIEEGKLDAIIEAPLDFFAILERTDADRATAAPLVQVHARPDLHGQLAQKRVMRLVDSWKSELRHVRLTRAGVTSQFLEPFTLPPSQVKTQAASENFADLVVRIFPFLLVMWTLAGALYPAVDLCAGEKERGTMETLLITPAGREEIVLGKFLTIWILSSATAILNLISMGISTAMLKNYLPSGGISFAALAWCAVLSLPQSAFFSALALAIGAYARSSKEGQYYLMPLFVLTMPLIFLTLAPGVELNPLYSMIPVTGVALLMQRLMTAPSLDAVPWLYFIPVLAPMGLYSWLALRWAIEQFNREEVLFREAERLDVMLWIKSLFRDKAAVPTTGQAFVCVGMVLGLRWLSLGLGANWSLEVRSGITEVAFVAVPALFMAILLNTRPRDALYLHLPAGRETWLAALLALLLLPAMTGLTQAVLWWFPQLLQGSHPLIEILRGINEGRDLSGTDIFMHLLAFALLPALCEEVVFRGFLLHGLHHRFRPRNAVLLSSFFFALFHMNVFLFLPTFILGVILGLLTVRSKSLLPAIAFHLLHNSVLILLIPISRYGEAMMPGLMLDVWPWFIGVCVIAAAALVWWLYRKPYAEHEEREAAESRQQM
jgi:sodium transport system permease protein